MNDKYKRNSYVIRVLFFEILFLGIFFYTAFNLKHIANFSVVFKSYNGLFKNISIYTYFITLDLLVAYYTIQLAFIIARGKLGWYSSLKKVDDKISIIDFVCKCFAILLFIMYYICTPCTISGASMNPTFHENENVLTVNTFWSLEKGDVIIFNASDYSDDENLYIKRIVAKKGDVLTYIESSKYLYVNDQIVNDLDGNPQIIYKDEYVNIRLSLSYNLLELTKYDIKVRSEFKNELFESLSNKYTYKIDSDKYVVLGDNRRNSNDSRNYGAINLADIYGKVWLRFYPFDKFGLTK